jgi:hypothetical protein
MYARFLLLLLSISLPVHAAESELGPPLSLRELAACRQALPSSTKKYVETSCHGRDVSSLVGMWRKELDESLGKPSWCNTKETIAIEAKSCIYSTELGYSFYVLPRNSLGGGPELVVALDGKDRVTSAKWVFTQ